MEIIIRPANLETDCDAIWNIFEQVISTGDTYSFSEKTPRSDLGKWWTGPIFHVFVAEIEEKIVGSYYLKPNQPDRGSHVANAGYMTERAARGRGVAQKMCAHSIEMARKMGFRAMQFNMVVSTNEGAVRLWQRMGFEIVGRLPQAFRHAELGFVDAFVMFQSL